MKRYSISLAIREKQIKTTLSYHETHMSVTKIWKTEPEKCGQKCEGAKTFLNTGVHAKCKLF